MREMKDEIPNLSKFFSLVVDCTPNAEFLKQIKELKKELNSDTIMRVITKNGGEFRGFREFYVSEKDPERYAVYYKDRFFIYSQCPYGVEDMEYFYQYYYYCHIITSYCKHEQYFDKNFIECPILKKRIVYEEIL